MAFKPPFIQHNHHGLMDSSLATVPRIAINGSPSPNTPAPTYKNHSHPRARPSNQHPSSFPPTPPSNSNESVQQAPSRMPGTLNRTSHRENRQAAQQASPRHKKLPTPDVTPPASLSPPQLFQSHLSSSVADSFQTARESPWLSEDDTSSQGDMITHWGPNGFIPQDLGLGFESHVQSRQRTPTLHNMEEVPDREWDTNLMRNITLRPKRKNKVPVLADPDNSNHVAPSHPESPRTPTFNDFNQKFMALATSPKRLPNASPSQSDTTTRRFSGVSSTSTIVEAIVITGPPVIPPKLRHVSKTASLRSTKSLKPTGQLPAKRVSSDSQYLKSLHTQPMMTELPAVRDSINGIPTIRQTRVITDPSIHHQREQPSTVGDAPRNFHAAEPSSQDASPPIKALNHARNQSSASVASTSPRSSTGFQSSHSRQTSRGSIRLREPTTRRTASPNATRSATYRALENALHPAFVPLPNSTTESVATVIKRPSNASVATTETQIFHTPVASQRLEDAFGGRPFSAQDDHLTVPGSTRRPSDASGKSLDRFDTGGRMSLDRVTLRSEDQPRHLYPQLTPFSVMSDMQESALEVSEATAISIYPHKNRSLLLVEQNGKVLKPEAPYINTELLRHEHLSIPMSPEPPRLSIQPSTPPPADAVAEIDSPLKNPRTAPPPPTINVHPATPLHDEEDPMARADTGPVRRPSILEKARRYSDNLIQPFITRSGSFKRRTHSQPPRQRNATKDAHLHPLWQPRDFWDNLSDSDSEWEADDDDYDPLPAGGDTSEPPPLPLPRRLTQKLPGFRGTGGFLIGNSLNLERHGTNKRRHHISPPSHFENTKPTLRRDSQDHDRITQLDLHPHLRNTQSLSSLRSFEVRRRRIRRRWRILGLQVQYIGISGMRDRWQHKKLAKEERKAEKRRDEIRRSIGPKFLVENGGLS